MWGHPFGESGNAGGAGHLGAPPIVLAPTRPGMVQQSGSVKSVEAPHTVPPTSEWGGSVRSYTPSYTHTPWLGSWAGEGAEEEDGRWTRFAP